MKWINVKYFYNQSSFSAEDFRNNKENEVRINPKYILSLTKLKDCALALSGEYVGKYALLTMSNNDCYVMREEAYKSLDTELKKL